MSPTELIPSECLSLTIDPILGFRCVSGSVMWERNSSFCTIPVGEPRSAGTNHRNVPAGGKLQTRNELFQEEEAVLPGGVWRRPPFSFLGQRAQASVGRLQVTQCRAPLPLPPAMPRFRFRPEEPLQPLLPVRKAVLLSVHPSDPFRRALLGRPGSPATCQAWPPAQGSPAGGTFWKPKFPAAHRSAEALWGAQRRFFRRRKKG